jgi:serine protease Do
MTRILLALTIAAILTSTAVAQSPKTKVDGKTAIVRLFNDAIAEARKSTVTVRYNNKVIGLGTIVTATGDILAKGSDLFAAMKKPADEDGLQIRLWDSVKHTATVAGYHEASDLVLLKVDAKGLVPAKFVDAKFAEPGNMIAAPGADSEAIAAGVISAGVRKLFKDEAVVDNQNKGYLGIMIDQARDNEGVFITELPDESPARKAKLKVGDQIFRIEDRTIDKYDDLRTTLSAYSPGDKVRVFVRRKSGDDTEELEFEVKLGRRPASPLDRGAMQNSLGSELSARRTGFEKVITHDMVLEPRDCGGPLVDLDGRVLGINIARAGRVETWALPPELIKTALAELKAGKHPVKK